MTNTTQSKLKKMMTLKDCKELKELIVEHPDLPLLIFAGEEAWNGDYPYSSCDASKPSIEELTLYGEMWIEKDDFREELENELCNNEDYTDLSDEDFEKVVDEKFENTEFIKAIAIYVG